MSKKSSLGLGRGLDALLGGGKAALPQHLKISELQPNPLQPRSYFDPEALQELANSIAQKGIVQPIVVRPKEGHYEIVAGERRFRASQLAGLSEVPVVVKELNDKEALEIAIIENLQREDLNPVEEAEAYQRLLSEGMSQEEVSQTLGKARSTIANALRLLQLPEPVLTALTHKTISAGHARAILAQPEADRLWALQTIVAHNLNVRQAEQLKRPQTSKKATKTVAYQDIALSLTRSLGSQVKISGEKKGKIEIAYHSMDELTHVLQVLGYNPDPAD